MKKCLTALSLAAMLLQGASSASAATAQVAETTALPESQSTATLEQIADMFFRDIMESSPVNLHFSYLNSDSYNISWNEPLGIFYESNEETIEILDRADNALDQLDVSSLDERDFQVYTWLKNYIYSQYELFDLPDYTPTLSPMDGILSTVDTVISEYAILSEADIETFLLVLQDIPRFLGEVVKELDYQASYGFVPCASAYEQMLDREEDLCTLDGHFFLEAFERNLAESGLSGEVTADALSRASDILETEVIPAYSDFFRVIEKQAEGAGEAHGLCWYDRGKEYYAALAEYNTGTGMSVSDLADYLEKNIQEDYRKLLQSYGSLDNIGVLDHVVYPASTAEGALDWLKDYTDEHMPKIDLPGYTLSYLPDALQIEGNLAYYLSAPLDLTTRNVIRVNGSEVGDEETLWITMAHEGYPGHLYQHQYFLQKVCRYPAETLLGSLGTTEGWAYYVERLAMKWAGIDDTVADIIFDDLALSMALMCRVDIGVNYDGWEKSDLASFLSPYYGELGDEDLTYYYETCAISPGLFLPYGVGYYKTRDLFDAMKDSYTDDTAMYEAYLSLGDMPFSLLELFLIPDKGI